MNHLLRVTITLTLVSLVLAGCSTLRSMRRPGPLVIIQPAGAKVLRVGPDGGKGDSLTTLRAGDTLRSIAYRSGRDVLMGARYGEYLVPIGTDSGFVTWPEVKEEWELQPTTFTLPSSADRDAWARANHYVGTHATMKIQTTSEFRVETYNPLKSTDRGFAVSRLPQGETVTYTVVATGDESSDYARKCALYIRTGR